MGFVLGIYTFQELPSFEINASTGFKGKMQRSRACMKATAASVGRAGRLLPSTHWAEPAIPQQGQ